MVNSKITVLKKIFFILIIFILLIFVTKDYVLRLYVTDAIKKMLVGECRIARFHISLRGIEIENFKFSNGDYEIAFEKGGLDFSLLHLPRIGLSNINLNDGKVTIENLERMKQQFGHRFAKSSSGKASILSLDIQGLSLRLKDIELTLKDINKMRLETKFSVSADIKDDGKLSIGELSIPDFNIQGQDFRMSHLSVKRSKGNLYNLDISSLKIKNKEIKDWLIPFEIQGGRIVFLKSQNIFFGPEALIEGELDFGDYQNLCLNLKLSETSLANIIEMFSDPESLSFEGAFGGQFTICSQALEFRVIRGRFTNYVKGFIHVEKEEALDFLKKYLDNRSYKALVDNFKNYTYNKGVIDVGKYGQDVMLDMTFDSLDMGQRHITLDFHNLLGGGE